MNVSEFENNTLHHERHGNWIFSVSQKKCQLNPHITSLALTGALCLDLICEKKEEISGCVLSIVVKLDIVLFPLWGFI